MRKENKELKILSLKMKVKQKNMNINDDELSQQINISKEEINKIKNIDNTVLFLSILRLNFWLEHKIMGGKK